MATKRAMKPPVSPKDQVLTPIGPAQNLTAWLGKIQTANLPHEAVADAIRPFSKAQMIRDAFVVLPKDQANPDEMFAWLNTHFPPTPAFVLPSWHQKGSPLLQGGRSDLGQGIPGTDLVLVRLSLVPPITSKDPKQVKAVFEATLNDPNGGGLAAMALAWQDPEHLWQIVGKQPFLCPGLSLLTPNGRSAGDNTNGPPTPTPLVVIPIGVQGRNNPSLSARASYAAAPIWSARIAP